MRIAFRVWLISMFIILFFAVIINVYSADIVQIATHRDVSGQFDNWSEQVVTWDTTIYNTCSDHYSTSSKALQTWMFPLEDGTFLKATFRRTILGEYAIRWSRDGEIWSDCETCTIIKPSTPRQR